LPPSDDSGINSCAAIMRNSQKGGFLSLAIIIEYVTSIQLF
jgi:hypothetical protein